METRQLVNLLHHYSGSSEQEAAEVISLLQKYPYSQVLQALSARVSKDHNFENQQFLLQSAAVYSTDRAVLKDIMSKVYETPYFIGEEIKKADSKTEATPIALKNDAIDYAEEVIHDLEKLNQLKHNFEELAASFGYTQPITIEDKLIRKSPVRPKKKTEEYTDPLIEAIKITKKKIEPESTKTKEQIQIIDQFIKAQPSIKPKSVNSPISDLTEVKNGEFDDNVISETLAQILIRQGRKEKAIEVYKKLIWKFPQKKVYFAAQIEDLKK